MIIDRINEREHFDFLMAFLCSFFILLLSINDGETLGKVKKSFSFFSEEVIHVDFTL